MKNSSQMIALGVSAILAVASGFGIAQEGSTSPTQNQGDAVTHKFSDQESTKNNKTEAKDKDDKKALDEKKKPTFDGEAAFAYLKQVCEFGSRASTSPGMLKQQEMLKKHFTDLGAQVHMQNFTIQHPAQPKYVQLTNLCVRFHPDRKERLLLCCHYDTRPYPDRDPVNPRGLFIGANDGASGVALLCELGKHMPKLEGRYGIDFVFFDAEEFVFVARRDQMFIGSTYFATQYANGQFPANYKYGILLDMVADADLQINYEGNSMDFAPRLARSIWGVANKLGVKEFEPKKRHKIRDDHLPLNSIARIPTIDIIDFDYPNPKSKNAYWHTTKDTVANCSADSLTKVGWVVLEWLKEIQKLKK